ncbi:MAG TPA: hypothetical protein VN281_01810, partial [Verrucomicrobiae bacterium]|nr:hypothetical protein [Verrucomicrobiae bacterium]
MSKLARFLGSFRQILSSFASLSSLFDLGKTSLTLPHRGRDWSAAPFPTWPILIDRHKALVFMESPVAPALNGVGVRGMLPALVPKGSSKPFFTTSSDPESWVV